VIVVSQGIASGVEEFPCVLSYPRAIEVATTIPVRKGRDDGVFINMNQPALHVDSHAVGEESSQLLRFERK
jgi:hypothetical protein